jgi:diguanylate cyclase (GGDEF)-like protein/PAS domain S-box-containing protein
MRCPSAIADEKGRMLALNEYGLSEEEVLPDLEPVVHIAARMLDMPVAAVNMVGSDHVFFAASYGIGESDMRRDVSFCAHAITQNDVMVVLDATLDPRFHDNPLVTGNTGIRFYAGVPLHSPSGHALGALCVVDSRPRSSFSQQDRERLKDLARLASDKLELRRLENARRNDSFRFEDIATTSPTAILCFDSEQIITFWNRAALALFGYASGEVVGKPVSMLAPVIGEHPLIEMLQGYIGSAHPSLSGSVQEVLAMHKDGSSIPIEMSLFCWMQSEQRHFGAMMTDITERRQQEDELYRLANFDSLTGLANRSLLQRRVTDELASASPAAVIAIDLDNFKDINDTLGTSVGDHVLAAIAERMRRCVRPIDTVSRTGGDEFAILLSQVGDPLRSAAVAESVIAAIARPLQVDDHEVRVAACCGIAISPAHGQETEELLGNADLALFQAKTGGSGQSFVFVPALRMQAVERRMYDAELHRAVEANEFELFYQPQVRIRDGVLAGAEALIRWKHPERGYLSPGVFLPALIGGSLAGVVGDWVLETACAQAAQWGFAPSVALRMGINLFAAQFHGNDLERRVAGALERHRLAPEAVELEIVENIILDQNDLILESLRKLRALGVRIAFDDFGTGYASLSLLKNYPLTRIKIDQTFVRNMSTSKREEATVAATVLLARNYDLEVIAEGVETQEQLETLARLECDEVQGYLFGKPMPAATFAQALRSRWPAIPAEPSLAEQNR